MQYIEHSHQKSLFQWARHPLTLKQYPELELLYANRNTQLAKTKAAAARIKAEGSLAGVPDIFLPVSNTALHPDNILHICHGFYIELKAPERKAKTEQSKGGLSKPQLEVFPKLIAQGYKLVVCYDWLDAKKELEEYLKIHYSQKNINTPITK